MYIVPYTIDPPVKSKAGFQLFKAQVFLANGGNQVWEEEGTPQEIVKTHLTPNGFHGKITSTKNNCLMFKLDDKTDFSDLYKWKEFLQDAKDVPDVFVLRPFIWIGNAKPGEYDDWGWREECEGVSLGRFGTLAELWGMLSKEV
jgi:hypothetical protein